MAQSTDRNPRWWRKIWIWLGPIRESDPEILKGKPAETSSEEFSRDVAAATALLKFLIKEGGPEPIRDQIIDDIEASRERLSNPAPPSKEERVKLLKAYGELARVPRTSVASARIPPVTFWSVDSQWPTLLIWIAIIPSIIALIVLGIRSPIEWYWALIYLLLSSLAVSGLYVFTGLVTPYKLNQIITFCYIFTGVAVVGSLLPFTLPNLFSEPAEPSKTSREAPLGILRGCAAQSGQADWHPTEVVCGRGGTQWVVRIGGTVTPPEASAAAPQSSEKPVPPPAQGAGEAAPQSGQTPAAPPKLGREITGGLVVPLYVIVLALVGGAISMTRRVPEYQRRAMDSRDPLTNAEAREYLVFQIMQVITAPLIAITAYYIFRPAAPLESVVVGFASGFASEPILVMIRALVDKLRPAGQPPQPAPISVAVTPSSATVPPKKTMQFTAKVSGSPNSEVTWLIDPSDGSAGSISQSGYYVAPDSPPTKAVTITARSAADPTKSGSVSVKVEPTGEKPAQPGAISVTVTPSPATVSAKKTQQFTAKVWGSPNSEVTWLIDPPEGAGTISQSGLYVAPDSPPTKAVTITARSVADPTKSASASVKVEPA
jgi:hypothetical protein